MPRTRRTIRINPSTLHREIQGEGVLLQLDTGQYFGLDEMAERMWALMMEHGDLARVETKLLEEFDVEPDALAGDLDRFVNALIERQLVEVTSEPATTS
jgi:hypothetical protein